MSGALKLGFVAMPATTKGVLVLFCGDALKFGPASRKAIGAAGNLIERAARAARFTGKSGTALELPVPEKLGLDRLIVIGIGKQSELKPSDITKFGGIAMGKVPASASDVVVFAELPDGAMSARQAADLATGLKLRHYVFDRYKTKRKDDDKPADKKVSVAVADVAQARKAYAPCEAVSDGVVIARDLVNEPANVLYPAEFARRATSLRKLKVAVEVLDVAAMRKLGMHALLGVGQGSAHDSRLVVMRWNGGRKTDAPVAFVGKGVCFDTGGISIKPAENMEDMKWDMGGAGAVAGLMHVLAGRKAKVNAVGILGLVENMPDGNAQRPGDVVTSLSGQTIEVINTDAEGRLVLADALWYCQDRFKPKFMVDLATLTGAMIIALGHDYAGCFSNNDELANNLLAASQAEGEPLWRMPLPDAYNKQIDSMIADVKNTGGRPAGSITAALFLKRFVNDTPWAHLDIAPTAWKKPSSVPTIPEGATGYGVRLLNRMVRDNYEA